MDGIQQGIQQGYPGVTGPYAPPFTPQNVAGTVPGAPLAGMIGSGIPGLFSQPGFTRPIGQVTNGIGGTFLPLAGADPVTAAYLQQVPFTPLPQFVPQAFPANLLAGHTPGYLSGSVFGNPYAGGLLGRSGVDFAASQQIQQLAQQQLAQLCQHFAQQAEIAQMIQLAQQAQFAPHGLFAGAQSAYPYLGSHVTGLAALGRVWPSQVNPIGIAGVYGAPWQGLPMY